MPDLRDCIDKLWDECSEDESAARAKIVAICRKVAQEFPHPADITELPVVDEEESDDE